VPQLRAISAGSNGDKVIFEHKTAMLSACHQWLEVDLGAPHSTIGWTLIGGGRYHAQSVFWHRVGDADLTPDIDAKRFFEERRWQRVGNLQGIGFLTGSPLTEFVDKRRDRGTFWARCVATVGLRNALRIGDPPNPATTGPGTVNIFLQTSCALNECASIEALSLVAEARTLAILEGNVTSNIGHAIATGTGTDCIVVASPIPANSSLAITYAGKHTEVGHLIGSCVYDALAQGIERWKQCQFERSASRAP